MNIVVIHGQMHKGSTYHVTKLLLNRIAAQDDIVVEFQLAKDAPGFCIGCFNCIVNGEDSCPHKEKVKPIVSALLTADVIIVDSPCYVLNMTGQLKTLFDHMAYMWISHRPEAVMFNKVGVVISTAAGAGTGKTTKCIKDNLFFWGIPKIHRVGVNVAAMSWDDVKPEKKEKITKRMDKLAVTIKREIGSVEPGLKMKIMFKLMKKSQEANDWNPVDREHWVKNGWLAGKTPWDTIDRSE